MIYLRIFTLPTTERQYIYNCQIRFILRFRNTKKPLELLIYLLCNHLIIMNHEINHCEEAIHILLMSKYTSSVRFALSVRPEFEAIVILKEFYSVVHYW